MVGRVFNVLDTEVGNQVLPLYTWNTAPTNGVGGTFAGTAVPGALLETPSALYQNQGTQASPNWVDISAGGGGTLTITDGTTTVDDVTDITFADSTVTDDGGGAATVTPTGGGLGPFTLTAAEDIAANSAVSVNSSGEAVQTWGPAPNITGVETLFTAALLGGLKRSNCAADIISQDATHFLAWAVSFSNTSGSALCACSVSGDTITVGTPISSANPLFYTTTALSNSLLVTTDQLTGDVIAGTISSLTITLGTPTSSGLAGSGFFGLAPLSATSFVIAGSTSGEVAVGTVSGTTITMGSAVTIGSGAMQDVSVAVLSSTVFVLAYNDANNNYAMTFVAGSVLGTVVTLGTPVALANTAVANTYLNIEKLTSTSFVAAFSNVNNYADNEGFGDLEAVVGSLATLVITLGTPAVVTPVFAGVTLNMSAGDSVPPIAIIDSTHVAFGAGPALPQVYTVSGTTLTPPAEEIYLPATIQGIFPIGNYVNQGAPYYEGTIVNGVVVAGSTLVVVDGGSNVYEVDQSTSVVSPVIQHAGLTNYGLNPLTSDTVVAWFFDYGGNFQARIINIEAINATPPIGITALGATSGNPVTIQNAGIVDIPSASFTPQQQQYSNGDGSLVTTNTGHLMGTAISATKLAVNIQG